MVRCDSEGMPCIVQSVWEYHGVYKAELFDGRVLEFYEYQIECISGRALRLLSQTWIYEMTELLALRKYWGQKQC
jgi:hypothetical protein